MIVRPHPPQPPLRPIVLTDLWPPDWNWDALSAIGTLLAVVVSLIALGSQRSRELQLREEEDKQQRRAQAGYISVWHEYRNKVTWIENRSEQPIYDAGVSLLLPQPAADGRLHMPIGIAGGVARVVPPRQRVPISSHKVSLENPIPILAFRDAQGVVWQRDDRGNLKELDVGVFEHFGVTPDHGYNYTFSEAL